MNVPRAMLALLICVILCLPLAADAQEGLIAAPPLPASLVPPAAGSTHPVFIQPENNTVPILFGIFGGIAGLFVADWWADRNCVDTCGQADIPTLFLGGALGAVIGYLLGGGELPDEPPPGRPWP